MLVRIAIIWFSLVVLPAFALFYQPTSGSLGSWLWEDEGRSTPDAGAPLAEGTPTQDAPTFDPRRQVAQSPPSTNRGPEIQQLELVPARIEPPPDGLVFPQVQVRDGRQQTQMGTSAELHGLTREACQDGRPGAEAAEYPTEAPRGLEAMTSRLRAAGATYYVLECWEGPPKRYRFRCQFPSTDGGLVPVQLEAISNDPREAVAAVCSEMERRRLRR